MKNAIPKKTYSFEEAMETLKPIMDKVQVNLIQAYYKGLEDGIERAQEIIKH